MADNVITGIGGFPVGTRIPAPERELYRDLRHPPKGVTQKEFAEAAHWFREHQDWYENPNSGFGYWPRPMDS